MNLQQNVQPRSSSNGFGRRRVDREIGAKSDNKMHTAKSTSSSIGNAGVANPSRDRLIYVFSYLLGLRVEVHVRNGCIISGIFHATNADKDFAIVLKMAQVIKDGSVRGQKLFTEIVKKPMDMIIQAKDLVQIIAKDVALNMEEFSNALPNERRKDLMIDSAISQSHHQEVGRELERWTPDADDPECPELEDIFNGTWNRNWNQFETNEALFGVKSTFDEELYTTKLERGPRMRELEREAARIAREIEGEETHDLHLAEERGIQFDEDLDLDEEIKYSAVQRDNDDHTFEESHNSFLDTYNTDNFGNSNASGIPKSYSNSSRSKFIDEPHALSSSLTAGVEASAQITSEKDAHHSGSNDHGTALADIPTKKTPVIYDESSLGEKQITNQDTQKNILNEFTERTVPEKAQTSEDDEEQLSADVRGPFSTVLCDPSSSSPNSKHVVAGPSEVCSVDSPIRSGTSAASASEHIVAVSVSSSRGLSPTSSVGSLSSEKSTLNPNAKEFKLNPNAKSFTPSASFRPPVPMSEGSFYYASNLPAVSPVHSVPMGIGIGPSYGGHQPVFNPQSAQLQSPQAYMHPSGPMYGQQMIIGQPRPFYYMPTYQPEMPYKGRNF